MPKIEKSKINNISTLYICIYFSRNVEGDNTEEGKYQGGSNKGFIFYNKPLRFILPFKLYVCIKCIKTKKNLKKIISTFLTKVFHMDQNQSYNMLVKFNQSETENKFYIRVRGKTSSV